MGDTFLIALVLSLKFVLCRNNLRLSYDYNFCVLVVCADDVLALIEFLDIIIDFLLRFSNISSIFYLLRLFLRYSLRFFYTIFFCDGIPCTLVL